MSDRTPRTVDNYVDGEWVAPTGDDCATVANSATGEEIAEVTFSSRADVDVAAAAAVGAYADWRTQPVEARVQPLFRLKALLEDHQDELAETIVREHGKTFAEARGELRRGIENVEVACGIPTQMQAGTLASAAPGIDESAVRHPLGVFTAITPFNFPGMIPLWFLPYAVATGNAFVLKPSERTPLTAAHIAELVDRAGFPDGLVNVVNGGAETASALLTHDDVVGASFVGSTPVARSVYETAAAHGKRVQAQGGAKNHIIVSDSADLEFAVEQTVGSAFANTGQRCLANPVAVVHADVYDAFAEQLVDRIGSMVVAPGDDPDAEMGPMVGERDRERVLEYIDVGLEEGATLLYDGREHGVPDEGAFLGPTVFGDATPKMRIVREEIFGPVLALVRATDFDEALAIVEESRFGNAASLFTERGREAKRFRHEVDAGNLGVNVGTAAPMAFFHFGGAGESFFGDLHAQGDDAVRFYTDERVYIERWPDVGADSA
ncbi:CoA-acylating methylmalonate-semialdehyde dehydrogenase [Natrialbaceae archaeon GCM10025810]|uniref:CoA-acylating methylmalonate-semialdehyde dehydrogenase n=1 Tax=Halovalidus salilacus TaxID=3075124 RepID=UPI0036234508